jgi:hypothetical protein
VELKQRREGARVDASGSESERLAQRELGASKLPPLCAVGVPGSAGNGDETNEWPGECWWVTETQIYSKVCGDDMASRK